jgi:hypothetical protein
MNLSAGGIFRPDSYLLRSLLTIRILVGSDAHIYAQNCACVNPVCRLAVRITWATLMGPQSRLFGLVIAFLQLILGDFPYIVDRV